MPSTRRFSTIVPRGLAERCASTILLVLANLLWASDGALSSGAFFALKQFFVKGTCYEKDLCYDDCRLCVGSEYREYGGCFTHHEADRWREKNCRPRRQNVHENG